MGLCELLGLLFALPFGEDLYHDTPITGLHILYLCIGGLFALAGPMWPFMRRRFPQNKLVLTLGSAATDARFWIVVLLMGFVYVAAPNMYRRATEPAVASSPPEAAAPSDDQLSQKIQDATKPLESRISELTGRNADLQRQLAQAQKVPQPSQPAAAPTELEIITATNKRLTQGDRERLSDVLFKLSGQLREAYTLWTLYARDDSNLDVSLRERTIGAKADEYVGELQNLVEQLGQYDKAVIDLRDNSYYQQQVDYVTGNPHLQNSAINLFANAVGDLWQFTAQWAKISNRDNPAVAPMLIKALSEAKEKARPFLAWQEAAEQRLTEMKKSIQ